MSASRRRTTRASSSGSGSCGSPRDALLLGILPVQVVRLIDFVTGPLVGQTLSAATARGHWIFLAPIDAQRASYSPLLFVIGLATVTAPRLARGAALLPRPRPPRAALGLRVPAA